MFPAYMPEINDLPHLVASLLPRDICSLALEAALLSHSTQEGGGGGLGTTRLPDGNL